MECHTIVGIDENTALVIDPQQGMCSVVGTGTVTVLRAGATTVCAAGERFAVKELGDFLPGGIGDIDGEVWQATKQGRQDGSARRAAMPQPDTEVQALTQCPCTGTGRSITGGSRTGCGTRSNASGEHCGTRAAGSGWSRRWRRRMNSALAHAKPASRLDEPTYSCCPTHFSGFRLG
ncbi:MAG: hypothetical protein U0X20_07345 [Caldilineaceae bacterium]